MLWVVALPVEAKPLVAHYALKKSPIATPFAWYHSPTNRHALVVSGVGKVNAAMAVAWAAAHYISTQALLNIGIAGGNEQALGSVWLAHQVRDDDTDHVTYPLATHHYTVPSAPLCTVSQPQLAQPGCLVDMEAAGFMQAASRFCTQERTHCLKIVSDNAAMTHQQLTASAIHDYMQAALPTIEQVSARLSTVDAMAMAWQQAAQQCLQQFGSTL